MDKCSKNPLYLLKILPMKAHEEPLNSGAELRAETSCEHRPEAGPEAFPERWAGGRRTICPGVRPAESPEVRPAESPEVRPAESPGAHSVASPEHRPGTGRAASAGAAPRFVVRSAAAADLDAVCGVVAEVVAALRRAGIDQWDEQYPDRACLDEDIRRGELQLVLHDGVPAALYAVNDRCDPAYAAGRWRAPEVSFRVLHRFCVAPAFQGTGLGGALLRQLEASLRAQGVAAVRLDVFTRNPAAQALYRRAGYRRVGQARWRKGLFDLMEKLL